MLLQTDSGSGTPPNAWSPLMSFAQLRADRTLLPREWGVYVTLYREEHQLFLRYVGSTVSKDGLWGRVLTAQVRRKNPYRQMAKATQEHRTAPNGLQRRYDQRTPYRAFGAGITYLYDGPGQRSFLSVIRDMASGEIVAHWMSASLGMELASVVLTQSVSKLGHGRLILALLHSDQGVHYTHPIYVKQLSDFGIVQSMSREGNCLDNAPTESFFGHMKDGIHLAGCHSLDEVRAIICQVHLRLQSPPLPVGKKEDGSC